MRICEAAGPIFGVFAVVLVAACAKSTPPAANPSTSQSSNQAPAPQAPRRLAISSIIEIRQKVVFQSGDATIPPESLALLDEIARVLNERPTIRKVVIKGHADANESEATGLSQERARAVMSYLVSRDVSETRLSARGLGSKRPIGGPGNDQAHNRRVEFKIVDQDVITEIIAIDPHTGAERVIEKQVKRQTFKNGEPPAEGGSRK